MASTGWPNASSKRKKRRTIGGFRGQAMGESYDHTIETSGNFSLGIVSEGHLGYDDGEAECGGNHIVVAVRVRPLFASEVAEGKRSCCDVVNGNTVVIRKGADPGAYLRSQKGSVNEYTFDAAFSPEAGQAEVYEGTAKPYISEILDGINVTVFAYGATGAGKTHTMMGSERVVGSDPNSSPGEVSGIVPKSLVELFGLLRERMREKCEEGDGRRVETWAVRVGYLQVYNEQLYDLLSPSSRPLRINEDPGKGVVVVAGLAEMEVNSSDEVLDLLRHGNANRRTEATGANQVSSRSHAVLQVVVTRRVLDGKRTESTRESKLSLIDLAGSERASATNNRGEQLRQGANINKSLLSLANCINALAANRRRRGGKGPSNVKYRDSKLTHLLKSSLEGRCRLVMIANVNPSHVYFDDSHNTLKYANRAKNIKVDPRTVGATRAAASASSEREERLEKEYQALKERNMLMEAQLEAMRNARGNVVPEPAGFTDLFPPNASSILSATSTTPGAPDRYAPHTAPVLSSVPPPTPTLALTSTPAPENPVAAGTEPKRSRLSGERMGSGTVSSTRSRKRLSAGEDRDGLLECEDVAMPPPASRSELGRGMGRGEMRQGPEELDSEENFKTCSTSPDRRSKLASRSRLPMPGSATKRKRGYDCRELDGNEHPERGSGESGVARAELETERTRVRELEGKVRELENSMSRMGEQHDLTMELVETWRHHKETADDSLEQERATVNELLNLLKEKEREIAQLRSQLGEPNLAERERQASPPTHEYIVESSLPSAGVSGFGTPMDVDCGTSWGTVGMDGAGSGSVPSCTTGRIGKERRVSRGESRPVFTDVTIERERRGSGVHLEGDAGGRSGGRMNAIGSSSRRIWEVQESLTPTSTGVNPSVLVSGPTTAVEMATDVRVRCKNNSMIPRSKKSMIPAPKLGTTKSHTQRRFGDLTNRMNVENEPLDTPVSIKPRASISASASGNGSILGVNDSTIGGSRGGSSARRLSSRASPHEVSSIAGRTRSRLSVGSTPGPTSVREVR